MKTFTRAIAGISPGIALTLVLVALSPAGAQSPALAPADGAAMTGPAMMERCKQMKAAKATMREDQQAHDAELTAQLAEMNRAPDARKTGLIATILTHVVEQRIAMDARKAEMEDQMMQHMMQHMQMGKESMPQCPMMRPPEGMKAMSGMKGMSGMASGEHEGHQPKKR